MGAARLVEFQRAFREYLQTGHHAPALAAAVRPAPAAPPRSRLRVYRNAYYVRLEDALAHDFPALRTVLGDAAFGPLMAEYVQAHPSRSPTLRQLGRHLPGWLHARGRHAPADVAALEWAVLESFDAVDAPVLAPEALAAIPPERWQHLRLRLHPAVHLLTVNCNALELWRAVRRKAAVPDLAAAPAQRLVVARTADGDPPVVQAVAEAEYGLLRAFADGAVFADACERLTAALGDPEAAPRRAAEALARAVARHWIRQLEEAP